LEEKIAEITIDLKSRRIERIDHHGSRFTFKCQRCSVFCCKLGGPKLSQKDIARLEEGGRRVSEFLNIDHMSLRCREDGSCVFLFFDTTTQVYTCSVYDYRPTLCRLYPLEFKRSGQNTYALRLIPCCNGLNAKDDESVDTNLIIKMTAQILIELLDANLI